MKKTPVFLIAIMAILLAACATPGGTTSQPAASQATVAGNPINNGPLTLASQLALGTIKLKETSLTVTADQAATLLPLWEGIRLFSSNANFSQIEYEALVKQIQDSMNPEQLNAITEMELSQAEIVRTLQALGLAGGFGSDANGRGTPIARTPGAQPGGGREGGFGGRGELPGGGFGSFPGGAGGVRPGGAMATPAIQATIMARQAQRANQANPILTAAVISYLRQLAGQ